MNNPERQASNSVNNDGIDPGLVREWVRKAKAGDEEAFGELVKIYYQRVYGLAYGMVGHVEDAKEIAQQAWVKAWTRLDTFKESAGFFTWVYRIASNACLDFLRSKSRRREDPLADGVEGFGDVQMERAASQVSRPDQNAERGETLRVFEEALGDLSPEHRMAITLREVDGLSYEEIAKLTGCRKGTVMSRIFYARKKLQEKMKDVL